MEKLTLEWFLRQLDNIRSNPEHAGKFRFIQDTFQFQIDDEVFTFYGYDHAIRSVTQEPVVHECAFRIGGSRQAWEQLLEGNLSISQGIHSLYGTLTVTGSRLAFQQNMYYLDQFIKALRG